jgi:ribonuclease BN (tRNA processing enzyme)
MRLTILGSGDAFSAGGRLMSCYMLEGGGRRFLVDCGPAVLTGLYRAGLTSNDIPLVFISHLHGDHFGGLPFLFIDAVYPRQRRTPLTLAGPLGLEARFRLACEVLYPRIASVKPDFELNFVELAPGVRREVEGITVTPFEVEHYSGSPSCALRFEVGEKVFAYSGDASWSGAVASAGKEADLYLLECYQYDRQLAMHLDYMTIDQNYAAIGARRTVLTHMGDAMLAARQHVDRTRYELADDGMVFDF